MLVGAEKPASVAGSSSSDEAKIGGMTPAVLSFSGRCEVSPWNMRLPTWRFGYWISSRRCARSKKTIRPMTADRKDDDGDDDAGRDRAGAAEFQRAG